MSITFDPWRALVAATDVMATARAPPAALQHLREDRLRRLLRVAVGNSPLYRRRLGTHAASLRLADLPPVTKAELMREFDDWTTDRKVHLEDLRRFIADPRNIGVPYLEKYVVWESSGSSGRPGIFVQDAAAMAIYDSLQALRRPTAGSLRRMLDPGYLGERVAFVGAMDGHYASAAAAARLTRLRPDLAAGFRTFSLLQPVRNLAAELDAFGPTILGTYPSAAVLLAQQHALGRLGARPVEVWTGGETLSPAMRAAITTAFGCTVVDSYGASEFYTLACECSHGRLHLNSDWAILEPVDEQGRPVRAGETGATVLLTNLANHVQPLIRYDLGDRVRLPGQACDCGSPWPVVEVQGRDDDVLHLTSREGRPVDLLPLALTTVLEEEASLFDFQLAQTGPWALELRTASHDETARDALRRGRKALAGFMARIGAPTVAIRTLAGHPYDHGRSGKASRVLAAAVQERSDRSRQRVTTACS